MAQYLHTASPVPPTLSTSYLVVCQQHICNRCTVLFRGWWAKACTAQNKYFFKLHPIHSWLNPDEEQVPRKRRLTTLKWSKSRYGSAHLQSQFSGNWCRRTVSSWPACGHVGHALFQALFPSSIFMFSTNFGWGVMNSIHETRKSNSIIPPEWAQSASRHIFPFTSTIYINKLNMITLLWICKIAQIWKSANHLLIIWNIKHIYFSIWF